MRGLPDPNDRVWRAGTLLYTAAGLSALFFWLLWGDFSYYLKDRSVTPAMQLLLHELHASNLVVGILLVSLPAAVGFLVMPVVGYRSDRHRGRWGRRIPFLIVPIPLTFASMLGLAFSPQVGAAIDRALGRWSPGGHASVILALAASWTLFEVCTSISNSVFLSLITDVVPREVLGRFFALFRIVSLAAGMIFLYSFFGRVEGHYVAVFVAIGAIYCVGFTAMCLKVKEGGYPPPPETERGLHLSRFAGGVKTYCRECFAQPRHRWLFLSFALTYMGGTAFNSFYVFYAKSLGMSMTALGRYGALQLLLSMLQAYPIGWLADRFHPLRLTLISLLVLAASAFVAFFFVHGAASFGMSLVVCGTLSGTWLTSSASLPSILFPKMKFAVLNSARLTSTLIGTLIAGAGCGWMLDLLHHDYRCLFLWWGGFVLLAFLATWAVYREVVRSPGLADRTAPE